jgi:hypothetical protein
MAHATITATLLPITPVHVPFAGAGACLVGSQPSRWKNHLQANSSLNCLSAHTIGNSDLEGLATTEEGNRRGEKKVI